MTALLKSLSDAEPRWEAVVHQAIDRLLVQEQTRQAAGARLLAAEPMQVDDWETLKAELSEAATGRLRGGLD